MNIFLDDIRDPLDTFHYMKDPIIYRLKKWVIIRSYDDFVKVITNNFNKGIFPELISFDHDLGMISYEINANTLNNMTDEEKIEKFGYAEKTGYDCAKWLVEFCMDNDLTLPDFRIHSQNPVGGKNINDFLTNFKKWQTK